MSLKIDAKTQIDNQITNITTADSITPSTVGSNLKNILDVVAPPVGSIIMYHTTSLSEFDVTGLGIAANVLGYAICNGNNTTPNLKGRFIVGYDPADSDYNTIGNTGGAKTVTLTSSEMPVGVRTGGTSTTFTEVIATGNAYKNTTAGGNQGHENRPPYFTLLYIKRIN